MIFDQRRLLSGIILALSVQNGISGEVWLLITSNHPEAIVSVNGTDRGITPQQSQDTLRIRVSNGICEIYAHKQINGKEYSDKQIIETTETTDDKETLVQLNLQEDNARIGIIPMTRSAQNNQTWRGQRIPNGRLEVPGRNF